MTSSLLVTESNVDDELFSLGWLMSDPMLHRINRSATGIGLFKAARSHPGASRQTNHPPCSIIDFYYLLINPVLEAMARVTREDLINLPLSALIPEGVETTLINRMAHVVETGLPFHYSDRFEQEGLLMQHDQVCLKADDGVLLLLLDVTFIPLTQGEYQRRTDLLEAILNKAPVNEIRNRLTAVIS